MRLEDGERLARDEFLALQAAYDALQGWRLLFGSARRLYATCDYETRIIRMSRPLIESEADPREVLDTVRHEAAHVLAAGDGHGPTWRAWARALGARPSVRAPATTNPGPPPRYSLVFDCPVRGPLLAGRYYRRPHVAEKRYGIRGIPESFGRLRLVEHDVPRESSCNNP